MRGDTVPRTAGVGEGGGGQPVLLRRDVGSGDGRQGGGGVYHRAGGGGSGSGIVTRRRRRPSSFPFSSADARRTHALAAAPRAFHSCGVRLPSFGCGPRQSRIVRQSRCTVVFRFETRFVRVAIKKKFINFAFSPRSTVVIYSMSPFVVVRSRCRVL